MNTIDLKVKKLVPEAKLPTYGTEFSAGLDLYVTKGHKIKPGEVYCFNTGIAMEIPEGKVGLVFPRSGMSTKYMVNLINCVAVIDEDYRGEIKIPLFNNNSEDLIVIEGGDRVAQIIIMDRPFVNVIESEELSESERGTKGFGSTGTK